LQRTPQNKKTEALNNNVYVKEKVKKKLSLEKFNKFLHLNSSPLDVKKKSYLKKVTVKN